MVEHQYWFSIELFLHYGATNTYFTVGQICLVLIFAKFAWHQLAHKFQFQSNSLAGTHSYNANKNIPGFKSKAKSEHQLAFTCSQLKTVKCGGDQGPHSIKCRPFLIICYVYSTCLCIMYIPLNPISHTCVPYSGF